MPTTTSVKHQDFVGEPMADKNVDLLAGIGKVSAEKLIAQGFDKVNNEEDFELLKAYVVLGQFLLLKKDQELFQEWLKETAGSNAHHSKCCYECLNDWCEQHL